MKACTRCKVIKSLDQFYKKIAKKNGMKEGSRCIACIIEASQISKLKYPERVRRETERARIKYRYGITPEDKQKMISQQGGCGICQKLIYGKNAHIDHNHSTTKVRGILCSTCNQGLGMFKDSEDFLIEAIRYLRRTKG